IVQLEPECVVQGLTLIHRLTPVFLSGHFGQKKHRARKGIRGSVGRYAFSLRSLSAPIIPACSSITAPLELSCLRRFLAASSRSNSASTTSASSSIPTCLSTTTSGLNPSLTALVHFFAFTSPQPEISLSLSSFALTAAFTAPISVRS